MKNVKIVVLLGQLFLAKYLLEFGSDSIMCVNSNEAIYKMVDAVTHVIKRLHYKYPLTKAMWKYFLFKIR